MSTDTTKANHRSADSFDLDGKWWQPCICGEKFSGTTPSAAYQKWERHAKSANSSESATAPSTTPARAKICGCGCGEPLAPRAGGLFRSGHDARFKSKLATAHAAGAEIRHPLTGRSEQALDVAKWLDDRRGEGTFWYDKVLAGHRPKAERTPRQRSGTISVTDRVAAGVAKVDKIMEFQATRRPASGDVGMVTLRSGKFGAQVLRRQDDANLQVRLLDGNARGQEIVVPDSRFDKTAKR